MDIAELTRQIEEKVAPEPLIAVQGLANTIASSDTVERLADPVSARDWLIESDLAAPSVEVDDRAVARLRELRDVVRALMDANHDGEPDPKASAHLARLAAEHPVALAAGADGRLAVDVAPPETVDAVIGQMVGIVFQAQLESQWERMKICAADECRWAFYDRSRNRGGNWCQMDGCGNRAKNRAYRARQTR
ncbi:MAG: CGNR zinc finger domain-containing protein [Solirubrobacterales bacterium]